MSRPFSRQSLGVLTAGAALKAAPWAGATCDIPPRTECLTEEPFNKMTARDRTDLGLFFWANRGSVRVPGMPLRWMPLVSVAPTEGTPDSAPTPSAPPSPPSSPHGSRSTAPGYEHFKDPPEGRSRPLHALYCFTEDSRPHRVIGAALLVTTAG